jgi:hypothetical protein
MDHLKFDLPPLVYCKEFLNSPMSAYKIGPQNKELIQGALNMISDCIACIEQTEKPHAQFSYGIIEKGLNALIAMTTEIKNEKYFDKFVYDYSFLAHNVNMNTVKNDTVQKKCEQLERFSTKKETLTETLIMFNTITDKLSGWKTFIPPSFKLSDHYFNVIKEE